VIERQYGPLGQACVQKVIVVVDFTSERARLPRVVWKALCAIDPERMLQFTLGPVDTWITPRAKAGFCSKMGIDATRKMGVGDARPWPGGWSR